MTNLFDKLIPADGNKKDRILLKRAIGKSLHDVNTATAAAFYANVACEKKFEERLFYIACLYCEQGRNGTLEVPSAWARYRKKHDIPNGMIARLVDSPWNDIVAISLVRIVRRLMADGYSIDMEAFARDIKKWNTKEVRLEWAKKMSTIKED